MLRYGKLIIPFQFHIIGVDTIYSNKVLVLTFIYLNFQKLALIPPPHRKKTLNKQKPKFYELNYKIARLFSRVDFIKRVFKFSLKYAYVTH